jgi:hypothetical protein
VVLDADTDPDQAILETTAAPWVEANRRIVEDPRGSLDLVRHGFRVRFRYPVMVREPGSETGLARPRVTCSGGWADFVEVPDVEQLAAAEHVITAVFPPARFEPQMRGLVQLHGCRVSRVGACASRTG